MSRVGLLYLCLLLLLRGAAQKGAYAWPIDTPHVVTGNYGELRANHFHAGIDFSTQGKVGLPVYAVADGQVARIRVNYGAYGRALYIAHSSDSLLSVYAHLNAYAGAIAHYVRRQQYAARSYELEVYPKDSLLHVRRGDLIGYSGNSGSSTGPHLHFELRGQKSEVPLNPFDYFSFADTVAPELTALGIYDLGDTLHPRFTHYLPVKRSGDQRLRLPKDTLVVHLPVVGIAFAALDRMLARGNPNVVHRARLLLDGIPVFSYRLTGIAFADQRYVNVFAETVRKQKFQKCFLPTLYPPIYPECLNKGRVQLNDTLVHAVMLELKDENGNTSTLQFWLQTKQTGGFRNLPASAGMLLPQHPQAIYSSGFGLAWPANTFFSPVVPWIDNQLESAGAFYIHPGSVALRNAYQLSFRVPLKWQPHVAYLVVENQGSFHVPIQRGDSLLVALRNFGSCHLYVDSLPPQIKPQLSAKRIRRTPEFREFNFVVRDNLSGLAVVNLYVNGTWVPAEFDAKNNLLLYPFADDTPKGPLYFEIEARDRVGNQRRWAYRLNRP